ncbi:MAG: hypothetical protein NTV33_05225 [Coprothermobacterota bacterium]|nr:hypothetical protein [Coprothermobacterota bacterium]
MGTKLKSVPFRCRLGGAGPVSGKRCPHCLRVKPLEAFYVKRNGHLSSWCKECAITTSHKGRGTGYRRVGLKRRVKRRRPVLAEEESLPPPPIAPLRLVDGRCAYAYPRGKVRCCQQHLPGTDLKSVPIGSRGKVRCWRMGETCAKPRRLCCPWLAKAWQ